MASFLLVAPDPDWRPWLIGLVAGGLVGLGVLMVSTFRYWSFKSLDLARPRSYRIALPIAAVILLLAFYPEAFLPVVASRLRPLRPARLARRPHPAAQPPRRTRTRRPR